MGKLDDAPIDRSAPTVPLPTFDERRRRWPSGALVAILLVVALGGVFAWYQLRRFESEAASALPLPPPAAPRPAAPPTPGRPPLPTLDASDAFVRAEAAGLSTDARFARWLGEESLLRRAAAVVAALGDGTVPVDQLSFLRPGRGFEVTRDNGRSVVAEASYHRWDDATEIFVSLDAAAVARLVHRLAPLLDQAWREVGNPALDFESALARAMAPLTAVEVPAAPPEVVADGAVFRYSRPDLESLSAAQKLLLRLGPVNAVRVQDELRQISAALAAPAG